jgi:hypothetical protein
MAYSKLMRNTGIGCLFILLAGVLSATAAAAGGNIEFSADTLESMAGQTPRKGRIYVGKEQVRTEFTMNGETVIQIIDLARQEATVINPGQKSYMRRRAPGDAAQAAPAGGDANPCAGMQNLVCRETGAEQINGRKAVKYEISGTGQQGMMQVWVDAERKIPVRQIMPDGSSMETRLLGSEKLAGRSVEKWEMTEQRADGESRTSAQWYDPELKMNLREEHPGGFSRELTNIKLGVQPADLFSVPAGYSEITMPQGGGQ